MDIIKHASDLNIKQRIKLRQNKKNYFCVRYLSTKKSFFNYRKYIVRYVYVYTYIYIYKNRFYLIYGDQEKGTYVGEILNISLFY